MRKIGIACLGLIVSLGAVAGESSEDGMKGKKLFEKYGCTNCHGQDGIHPTSKYVPILQGKSAAYFFENATVIFGDDRANRKVHAMHDQFCIGEAPEEGCYPAPSSQNLMVIANWLGSSSLPKKKRTPQELYVTSTEANKKLKELGDKAMFVDVRTRAEAAFLGMPTGAHANVPYMTAGAFDEWDDKKKNFKLQPNSEFVLRMEDLVKTRGLEKDSPIFLICRSGSRSAKAAKILNLAGYPNVFTVTDGFEGDKAKQGPRKGERVVNGWKNSGLPWSYKLSKEAMYWEI
jgi:rhodanese-related sulfurtransferase